MDGDDTIMSKDHHSLIPTFLLYVPESERNLITAALENFDSVESEDLMDVLDSYRVRRHVTAENTPLPHPPPPPRLGRFAPLPLLYNYFQCFFFTLIFMPESIVESVMHSLCPMNFPAVFMLAEFLSSSESHITHTR